MNRDEYRAALDKLAFTQVFAARLFGVNDATSRRWARDGVNTMTVIILLRLLLTKKIAVKDIVRARRRLNQ